MNVLKNLPATVTVVFGILFLFVLGFQTPRQGRGPATEKNGECQLPDPCVAQRVSELNDPAHVFDTVPLDTTVTDSGAVLDPTTAVRA